VLVAAALPDPDATVRCEGERAAVVGLKAEIRLRIPRPVVRPFAQVAVDRIRIDDLPGVHLPLGIPHALELAERLHDLLAVHDREILGARLAVAVLPRERTAVVPNHVRCFVHEAFELLHACGVAQVEVDAAVDAALTEVSVQGRVVAVLVVERPEIAQVATDAVRRHRRVFPPRMERWTIGDLRRRAQPRLAHLPQLLLIVFVDQQLAVDRAFRAKIFLAALGHRDRAVFVADAPELAHQPAFGLAVGPSQQILVLRVELLRVHEVDQLLVEPLERDRLVLVDLGYRVTGGIHVGEPEDEDDALIGVRDQLDLRREDDGARAFRPHQRARDVEAVVGEQLLERVPRDAARDVGEAFADLARVAIADRAQAAVDLADAIGTPAQLVELVVGRRPDAHPDAVVGQDVELEDVLLGLSGHLRVHPAGVVADHPPQRVVRVRRGVGSERQTVLRHVLTELVEHQPRLDAGPTLLDVHFEHAIEVFREVDDDRDVAALACQRRAAAAREDRRPIRPRHFDRRDHVVNRARDDDPDRNLAIVGGVGRVECAAPLVEAHLPRNPVPQRGGNRLRVAVPRPELVRPVAGWWSAAVHRR
jgi:hypothetical protein